MNKRISRRQFIAGAATTGGLLVAGAGGFSLARRNGLLPPTYGSLLGVGEALTFAAHRVLLRNQPLAREYGREMISKKFPAINTTNPEDATYQSLLAGNFRDWRLPITGLIAQPAELSLDELKRFPARTQVTRQTCEQGWSAIGEWTGVQLARVLSAVGMRPEARYVVFHTVDEWWDSIDMLDALHPQTLLAYGMNGGALPVAHGTPIRLRVERQLGYKNLKYVSRITVTNRLDNIENGAGAGGVEYGYSWYAGI